METRLQGLDSTPETVMDILDISYVRSESPRPCDGFTSPRHSLGEANFKCFFKVPSRNKAPRVLKMNMYFKIY